MKKIFLLVVILFATLYGWGADIFTSNLDKTSLTGATATLSNCSVADAPTWASGYTKAYLTSSSSGYATIAFDPALDLSGYDDVELTVQWGSANGRPLNASFNGGSNVSLSGNLASGDRSKVVSSSCAISASTLSTLKLVSSGGSGVYLFAISISGTTACAATQPGSISKGSVSGGVITLTASGSPAADNTWYWQSAADGTSTGESGATKDVTTAGTYYIRSHHDIDNCWSAASSITVKARDFGVSCPGTGGGVVFSWTPKSGLSDANIPAGTHALPGEWLETLEGGEAELYVKSGGGMRIRNSELNYNSGDAYIHVTLDCELWEGDVISITSAANANDIKITTNAIKPGSSGSILAATITQGTDYTIPTGNALIGLTEFYLWRNSSSTNIGTVTITRPKTGATYTWTCPVSVTQGSSSTISVSSDCSEPVSLAWVNSPIAGVSFDAGTGELSVGSGVPLGTEIKITASNGAGACAATSETKTIIVDLPAPTFVWDYASTVNAGGIYPISVSSTGDANVTIEIVETITGVSGSFTAGNPATGNVTLGNYPAAETFTYRASSPATATYKAKSETRTVTIVRCVKSDNLPYVSPATDGKTTTPRYYCETSGVGKIMKDRGGSSISPSSGSYPGESWTTVYLKANNHSIQTYQRDVFKIVLYVYAESNNTHITTLKYSDSYMADDGDGTNILSSSQIIYNNNPSQASLTKNAYETAEITLSSPMSKDGWIYLSFSSSTRVYGVKLYSAGGDEVTSVAFSGETEIEKYPGDAPFIKAATQTTTLIPSGGSITYKSSDESVATVDPATGEVIVRAPGRTTITAKLDAFGCFKEARATYSLVAKKCSDPKCTVAVTSGSARKCAGESVTLTATAAAGAEIQWYKDGAAIPGETGLTLTTTTAGKYHATATKVCLQLSDTIEVVDLEAPTAVALHEYYYIKAGRPRPDIPLFKLTNVKIASSSFTMNHPAPAGCSYELREDGIVYLVGTPSTTLAASTYSLTVTTVNDCGFANASATLELRTLEPTAKKQIAWIGCKGDGKHQQSLPGTLDGSQSTDHSLYKYLTGSITPSDPSDDWFVLTSVNAYCTIDPQKISDYYSQFDLILLTDYPDSHICPTEDIDPSTGEKYKKTDANSYSNAIGCLIDEIPILTFEAFVAGLPNWGINTTPGPESPNEKTITLLCSAHNIFNNTFPVDEQIDFVTSSGMQGFEGLEAPPGMVYIATIPDGSGGTRITCCERQKVIEARMMMMGLNHNAMAYVTEDGKTIIKQIIEYLLQFEEMADCSLVFDNGMGDSTPFDEAAYHTAGGTGTRGDGKWSTAANWYPAYNAVPKPFQAVRVDRPCQVDVTNAHCSSIRLRKDGTHGWNGNLTIHSDAGLTVIDYIKEVHGSNFMTTYPSAASDLVIQASTTSQNGSLAFGNAEDDLQATVEYYSLASGAKTSNPVWQYIGIPITDRPQAIDAYHAAWMCSWESEGNVSSNWVWVENEDRIVPFKGYCITQQASKKYIHTGALCTPNKKEFPLYYFTSVDGNGFNMFANSWVAPIDIAKMKAEDFDGAEPTIYVYNTGSRKQYDDGGLPSTDGTNTGAGQFNAVPVNSALYMSGALTKIPTMQGFFVQATREGTLTLDYDRICFNSTDYTTTAETMRAPKRRAEDSSVEKIVPEVMRLDVISANWGDRLYILTHEEFSDAFDLGWDGTKQVGDAEAPMLAFIQGNKQLAVAAISSLEERELSFRAGNETEYTFCFNYEGETIYLYDRLTGEATEIKTGNTYSFTAENKTPAKRFIITKNPPRVPTDIENTTYDATQSGAEKCIIDGQLYIIKDNRFYDARGVRVTSFKRKEVAP